jgi:polyisoprenyl-phosphate glycosyltransferase
MAKLISVIVPAFNEEDVIEKCLTRLAEVLKTLDEDYEILIVDDGSTDSTCKIVNTFRETNPRVALLELSRNFRKEVALTAGLDHARGDAVIVIDADLQDPPELIHAFVEEWRNGYDIVYGMRTNREGETWLKLFTARWFYRVLNAVSDVPIPTDTGDFRLMSRRAVVALISLRETHRYMKGLYAWIGFPQKAVPYSRHARHAGNTKWNYWRLWNFAIEGITSFSAVPLKLATYLGVGASILAFSYGTFMVARTLLFGNPVAGYPSLIVIVLFLGGIQLTCLGIIGEYLGRIYNEAKRRSLYFVKGYHPSATDDGDHPLTEPHPP